MQTILVSLGNTHQPDTCTHNIQTIHTSNHEPGRGLPTNRFIVDKSLPRYLIRRVYPAQTLHTHYDQRISPAEQEPGIVHTRSAAYFLSIRFSVFVPHAVSRSRFSHDSHLTQGE